LVISRAGYCEKYLDQTDKQRMRERERENGKMENVRNEELHDGLFEVPTNATVKDTLFFRFTVSYHH
jgi:hypothetical protein